MFPCNQVSIDHSATSMCSYIPPAPNFETDNPTQKVRVTQFPTQRPANTVYAI